ncbi:hypothetical protein DFH08DRAFT_837116 [Mycena albidolilacea]|uniref:F-box domain-containing protein n=1 Tax=Mycena albidolilacea TaxID=1033008 RepID=A0AAD7F3V6_9AGAR|nr:hypothetical protein DFH08DRAFT_837116 [Mycena albidolilacea]
MHSCLLIAEIFSRIAFFSTNDGPYEGRLGKDEVYNLALTCKAFSEPALDAIWRDIYGLMDLVNLLPADLWRGSDAPEDPESTCCMTRDTVRSDWTRFLAHARRVRELVFVSLDDDSLSPPPWNTSIFDSDTVLRHLAEQCPQTHMLPNLLELVWSSEVENIQLFICPTMRSLSLNSSTAYPGAIQLLETQSSIITSLELNHRWGAEHLVTDEVVNTVSLAICRMDRLVTFRCGFTIQSGALAHLSTLPTLKTIGISLDSVDDPTFFSATSSAFFPSVIDLHVDPSRSTLLLSLFNAISSTSLGSIWWYLGDSDPNNVLGALSVLANHRSRDVLYSIGISTPWDLLLGGLPTDLIHMQTLKPLLTLTNLTELRLLVPWVDLGNDDLEQIALHLPRLLNLDLGSRGLLIPPRITLRGLVPLFEHCSLVLLGIVINVGDDVPESEFTLPPILSSRVTRCAQHLGFLDFGNSRIGPTKVEPAATFLSKLVPKLTTLSGWEDMPDDYVDPVPPPSSSEMLWKQVANMYGQLTVDERHPGAWHSWQ